MPAAEWQVTYDGVCAYAWAAEIPDLPEALRAAEVAKDTGNRITDSSVMRADKCAPASGCYDS